MANTGRGGEKWAREERAASGQGGPWGPNPFEAP